MKRFILLVLSLLIAIGASAAEILLRPADELTLLRESEIVVFGKVSSTKAQFNGKDIETVVTIEPVEAFKGDVDGSPITLVEPGGVVGTYGQFVSFAPHYRQGEHALLFLRRSGDDLRAVRLGFGKFDWVATDAGVRLQRRPSPAHFNSRQPGELLGSLRAISGSRLFRAYPKDSEALAPSTRNLPDEFLIEVCGGGSCLPARVPNFDDGQPVVYSLISLQPGQNSVAGVAAGAQAWENHPGSRIDFELNGNSGVGFTQDGQNTIELNSQFVADEGFYALTYFWAQNTHQALGRTFFSIVENDHGFAADVSEPAAVFEQAMALNFGVGIGFAQPNSDDSDTVLSADISGDRGANLGNYDRLAASTVYPVSLSGVPRIATFSATPNRIRRGQSALLSWATNAVSVEISGLGSHPAVGTLTVNPQNTTTYTLTAIGSAGNSQATARVEVLTDPRISVEAIPEPIFQETNSPGGTSFYVLRNIGGGPTTIELEQNGSFFTQSPETFTLQPGAFQRVVITGQAVSRGVYVGFAAPTGDGVPANLRIPVRMLVVSRPTGSTAASALRKRVDIAGSGNTATGTASFTNTGSSTLEGILSSNVPWIIPQDGLIVIDPGETEQVTYTIDRTLRTEGATVGSATGTLSLVFPGAASSKGAALRNGTTTSSTLVTIVDTKTPATTTSGVPALAAGEVAHFIPGVGHIVGTVGTFVSDISITNLLSTNSLTSLDMYYTPIGGSSTQSTKATVNNVTTTTPLAVADVVSTVYNQNSQIGSLQVRGADEAAIALNANVFNSSNPQGTYGTTLPIMRSDRSRGPGETVFLTGLSVTESSHTNIYIQELTGGEVQIEIDFLDASGTIVKTVPSAVGPFQLATLGAGILQLPIGTVSALLTSSVDSTGRFSAYATPVDKISGDTWAVADWPGELGYDPGQPMVIPVAGSLTGKNNTFFRTDLAILHRGIASASGTLVYFPRGGAPMSTSLVFGPNETIAFTDVAATLFNAPGTVGFLVFTPDGGQYTISSRTYTTSDESPATYGSATPTTSLTDSLALGEVLRIGGVDDSSSASISAAKGGSFRSNMALLETAGAPVTIRATLYFSFAAGSLVSGRGVATKDYTLAPNEFLLLGSIASEILGEDRATLGDLYNLQADFTIISGEGEAIAMISSVDNGTGDSLLRTQ